MVDEQNPQFGRLKRGLKELGVDALLSSINKRDPHPETDTIVRIPLSALVPSPLQPRRDFDEGALQDLAQSLKEQGVIQPIVVREHEEGYEIIAGERRYRAAQIAQLETLPAVIREMTDQEASVIAIIENVQRESLNVLDQALAMQQLTTDYGLTHDAIAQAIGKSRVSITNTIRLLRLPEDIQQSLRSEDMDMGHARCLLTLHPDQQKTLAKKIVQQKLSVRATEAWVKRHYENETKQRQQLNTTAQQKIHDIEDHLTTQWGMKVTINYDARRGGKLVFHAPNKQLMQHLIDRLAQTAPAMPEVEEV